MREFLQNVKYTALILALMVVAGIVIVAIVDVLEQWFGIETVFGILMVVLSFQAYGWVKSARKLINDNED